MANKRATEAESTAMFLGEKIVGYRIMNTIISADKEFWGFQMENDKGNVKYAWVNCDPEGNGPGWLDIIERGKS